MAIIVSSNSAAAYGSRFEAEFDAEWPWKRISKPGEWITRPQHYGKSQFRNFVGSAP
jgi:hypothetical protein